MTDRADWAVCMVAPRGLAVGSDLELVEARTDAFVRDWFTPAERDLVLRRRDRATRDLLANLVWSAKESALKVLETGLRRDTRSVEVDVVETDGDERWARLVVRAEEGSDVPGLVAPLRRLPAHRSPPTATPRRPSRWRSRPASPRAVPSHSWLPEQ